jgi:hypothetical protein
MPLTRDRPRFGIGYHGPIPPGIWEIVKLAYSGGIAVSSNFAREQATELALAASLGWVSTISPDGLSYGRRWFATIEGLVALQSNLQEDNTL